MPPVILVSRIVLMPYPWLPGRDPFGPPSRWQVSQLLKAAVSIDLMVKTGDNRWLSRRHAVAKELPRSVVEIM